MTTTMFPITPTPTPATFHDLFAAPDTTEPHNPEVTAPVATAGPDATASRFGFSYVAVRVSGALAVLHATPGEVGLFGLARRTDAGIVHHRPLRDGIHAWLSGDYRGFGPLNLTGGCLLHALAPAGHHSGLGIGIGLGSGADEMDHDDLPGVYGQIVFTGFDGHAPVGLTPAQHAALTDAHARAEQIEADLWAAYRW